MPRLPARDIGGRNRTSTVQIIADAFWGGLRSARSNDAYKTGTADRRGAFSHSHRTGREPERQPDNAARRNGSIRHSMRKLWPLFFVPIAAPELVASVLAGRYGAGLGVDSLREGVHKLLDFAMKLTGHPAFRAYQEMTTLAGEATSSIPQVPEVHPESLHTASPSSSSTQSAGEGQSAEQRIKDYGFYYVPNYGPVPLGGPGAAEAKQAAQVKIEATRAAKEAARFAREAARAARDADQEEEIAGIRPRVEEIE